MTARDWLRRNGYEDVVELIDEVMAALEARNSKERRNWWAVLAGGRDGRPSVVGGREFPVLRVAQIRQRKAITENAIWRSKEERPPDLVRTGRWADKQSRGGRRVTGQDEGDGKATGGGVGGRRVDDME